MSLAQSPVLPINDDNGNIAIPSCESPQGPLQPPLASDKNKNDVKDCDNNSHLLEVNQASDNQDKNGPTTNQVCESSSDECILIPKHAVVDDVALKFILHPNLSPADLYSGSSLQLCTTEEVRPPLEKEKSESSGIRKDVKTIINKGKASTLLQSSRVSGRTGASNPSTSPSGEQFVIKTAKEILYDIAKGKWNRKGMVIDEEFEGIKKFSSKPCSNANCVRAAENERRKKDKLLFQDFRNTETVFEEGNLPSYHSMLNMWRHQENNKQKHTWLQSAFKNGFPENETEFLKVWRECRKNPEAFGIIKSEPGKLPEIQERQFGCRVRKVVKPYEKRLLVGEAVDKRPPVRLASKEYYNPEWKPVKNLRERTKQKYRYDALRRLYPHLPELRDTDYKMNPATVKYRMRQAEEWHKLVTISNKPTPVVQLSYYAADRENQNNSNNSDTNIDIRPESTESDELDFQTGQAGV